jgi:hypothetical protein
MDPDKGRNKQKKNEIKALYLGFNPQTRQQSSLDVMPKILEFAMSI